MNVKLIRMWSGEDVVTDLVDENENFVTVVNPIVAVPTQEGQMGFAPWSPLLEGRDKRIEITKRYVVYISDPQSQIVDEYGKMFSPIATPPKKLIL